MYKEIAMGTDTYLYSFIPENILNFMKEWKVSNQREKQIFNSIFENESLKDVWSIKQKIINLEKH